MSNFIEELKARRSQYALTSESPVSDQEIVKTVEDVTVQVPSAFNSQPQRAVVLFGDANQKLWNIVKETLRKVVSDDEAFKATEAKINAFAAGHGTVLFYDDTDVTKQLQKNFRPTLRTSPDSPVMPPACCSSPCGPRSPRRGLAHPCSTTTR